LRNGDVEPELAMLSTPVSIIYLTNAHSFLRCLRGTFIFRSHRYAVQRCPETCSKYRILQGSRCSSTAVGTQDDTRFNKFRPKFETKT